MSTPNSMTRPEATAWSIDDILRRAREGELFVPVFQRNYRWKAKDIENLFDSIYRGYPIGNLLLWETDRKEGAQAKFGDLSFHPAAGKQMLIIDGQQRISSFVAVLLGGPESEEKFRLYFDLNQGVFTYRPGSDKDLPLHVISDTVKFLEWLQNRTLTPAQVNRANQLVRALRDYRVPVYIVRTVDDTAIREIFFRLNDAGQSLQPNEVFDALLRGREGTGKDLRSLSNWTSSLGFGRIGEEWCLKAVAALLQIDVTKNLGEALRLRSEQERQKAIGDTEHALTKTVKFLREEVGIPHIELMPYRLPLVALTKVFHFIPNPQPESRHALVEWVLRGAQTGEHQRADSHTIRPVLRAISDNEHETIQWFRESAPLTGQSFQIPEHRFFSAGTKLTCAALASLNPRHLITGEPINLASLLDSAGAKSCLRIFEYNDTANRILHPTVAGSLRDALIWASQEVLESHLISENARAAIVSGETSGFLELRRTALQSAVSKFLYDRVSSSAIQ